MRSSQSPELAPSYSSQSYSRRPSALLVWRPRSLSSLAYATPDWPALPSRNRLPPSSLFQPFLLAQLSIAQFFLFYTLIHFLTSNFWLRKPYLRSIEHPGVVSHAPKTYLQPKLRIYDLALAARPPQIIKLSPHAPSPFVSFPQLFSSMQ
jgi:hypothetical protein